MVVVEEPNLYQITIGGKTYNIPDYSYDESWKKKYDPNLLHLPWNAFDPGLQMTIF